MNNRLLRLLADNRSVKSAKRGCFFDKANDSKEATVYVYDAIVASRLEAEWFGGVAAEDFVREFAALDAETIHLRINSPGGDVFAARAMEQAIVQHKARVITHIDGYAASAASILALAGDESEINEGGSLMIHKAWSFAMGNADDFLTQAALLEQVDNTLVTTYAKRTGIAAEEIRAMLDDETWLFGQDAVDGGWIDRIAADAPTVEDSPQWNVSALLRHKRSRTEPKDDVIINNAPARAEYERRQKHYERIAA